MSFKRRFKRAGRNAVPVEDQIAQAYLNTLRMLGGQAGQAGMIAGGTLRDLVGGTTDAVSIVQRMIDWRTADGNVRTHAVLVATSAVLAQVNRRDGTAIGVNNVVLGQLTWFHSTRRELAPRVLEEGLRIGSPANLDEYGDPEAPSIYVASSPYLVGNPNYVALAVDLSGFGWADVDDASADAYLANPRASGWLRLTVNVPPHCLRPMDVDEAHRVGMRAHGALMGGM